MTSKLKNHDSNMKFNLICAIKCSANKEIGKQKIWILRCM